MSFEWSTNSSDDVIDLRDVIERVEELEEQRTPRFAAGFNMPGYMPDSEPAEFDSAEGAKAYIIGCLKRAEDAAEDEAQAEALCAFAEEVNLEGDEFSVQGPDGLVYWVTEDGTMGLDDAEQAELDTLTALLADLKGYGGDELWRGDWYPLTLIRESHFTDYAQELAKDIGAINSNATWPNNCIDWEQAARQLKMDYSTVYVDGTEYYYR